MLSNCDHYTAGVATVYPPSTLTGAATYQHLARGFTIGMGFHSATVTRLADAKPMHCHRADGRWRLYVLVDRVRPGTPSSQLTALYGHIEQTLVPRYTPLGADPDAVFDVRTVFQQRHRDLRLDELPSLLLPRKGRYALVDYEKALAPDWTTGADDIFDLRGIDRERGALVVVRPDQYVAQVLPLAAHSELTAFAPVLLAEPRLTFDHSPA